MELLRGAHGSARSIRERVAPVGLIAALLLGAMVVALGQGHAPRPKEATTHEGRGVSAGAQVTAQRPAMEENGARNQDADQSTGPATPPAVRSEDDGRTDEKQLARANPALPNRDVGPLPNAALPQSGSLSAPPYSLP